MKSLMLSFLLSAATVAALFSPSYAQKTGDEAAILSVLNNSRLAFDKRDLNGFTSYFIQSPNLYYQVYSGNEHMLLAYGWEAMKRMVGDHLKKEPASLAGKHTASDFRTHINGNMAWVTSMGHLDLGGEKKESRDLFILQKQNGQWKIAALTTQEYTREKLALIK
ncbi:YybH family protein [Larkinella bovis]|uniref:YybH family protein n=1 Tax=Larkinella bovis TaxID=683041 RepID=A0ABW0I438_9BACT